MTSKVFVGNLAFQTTDQALAEAFQDCGKVKTGVVITRGRRSLGYGFVEFESHESAIEAVKSKNNVELKGRNLKVELASDNPVRPVNLSGGGGPGGNPSGGASPSQQTGGNSGPVSDNAGGGGGGPRRGPPRQRNFRPNNRRQDNNNKSGNPPQRKQQGQVKAVVVDNTQNPNPKNPNLNPTGGNNPSGGGGSNPGAGGNPRGGSNTGGGGNPRGPRQPRQPRNKRPPQDRNFPPVENRVLSKTAVFVANLPFNVKDEELLNFFKDNNPKSAHVVQTRTGRSRGYGFVDFDNENDQQAAILTKNNLNFPSSDRQITVTASYKTPEVAATIN
jgi:RNA recognition motif-containing protein